MSLADGEYDIDLSGLIDVPSTSSNSFGQNIALRYNFIPDSMDQSKPLRLYQNDQSCLLKAKSTDGGDVKPIIFEGTPQRASNTVNDSYFLTYTADKDNTVQLKRLQTTYRLSKSRNVAQLLPKIQQWDKEYTVVTPVEKTVRPKKTKKSIPKSVPKPPPPPSTSLKIDQVPKVSSKRPPTANSTPLEEPIINESDFDDLDDQIRMDDSDDKELDFPIISFDNKEEDKVKAPARIRKPSPEVDTRRRTASKKLSKKPATNMEKSTSLGKAKVIEKVSNDMDMDDEFKDLEDQLQEVLEEDDDDDDDDGITVTPPDQLKLNIDSDESDIDDFQYGGIKIEDDTVKPKKKNRFNVLSKPVEGRPTSLRDFVGGEKNDDDLSVSEEE
ncbi:RNA polymerase II transcription elongation factor-domain-containing protein [Scheffersomyces coipomensis]|uniref:RNA polymerase II transcription elongation factor-domain-containing protein n=1 Tax=Scheffersomyces coipomensis TaxID=1788519 RepID=UPI00315D6A93